MVSILIFLSTFFDLETFLKDFEVFFKMFDPLHELLNPFYLSDISTFVWFSFSFRLSYFRRILYLITLKKVFYFCKATKNWTDPFILKQLQVGAHYLSAFVFEDTTCLAVAVLNTQKKQSGEFLTDHFEDSLAILNCLSKEILYPNKIFFCIV